MHGEISHRVSAFSTIFPRYNLKSETSLVHPTGGISLREKFRFEKRKAINLREFLLRSASILFLGGESNKNLHTLGGASEALRVKLD